MLNFPRWKIVFILLTCVLGILAAVPNFFTRDQVANFPVWLPSSQVNLGLDLQGGSHMLLEVDVEAVIAERLEALIDDVRQSLRRVRDGVRVNYTGLRIVGSEVHFRLRDVTQEAEAIDRVELLAQPITSNLLTANLTDLEVEALGDGLLAVRLTPEGVNQRRINAVQQSIEIVRRRVDEMGTREPTIQRQGTDRILVQVPGLQDPRELRDMLNTTAKLTFHLVDETASPTDIESGRLPPGSMVINAADGVSPPISVRRRAMVAGENLVDAQPSFDQQTGRPVVSIRFDVAGARQFGDATRANVNRRFAIVLDNEFISAPVIREPITGGRAQISGGFTVQTATDLSILLRAGALPAPLTILEERSVGPDLGADSIAAGKIAAIIGLILVVVFILLSYGFFGLAANVALAVNVAMLFGALSFIGATLTLPGIAGIVLTVGMAVDANVLVFERIREELRAGKVPFAAVDNGYSQALSTILDANITTLIAAVILFQFGSGPIKGFAVTLTIGIITSVFTAVTLTRLFLAIWLRRKRPTTITV
jgi:protein-export membrane protein SecD